MLAHTIPLLSTRVDGETYTQTVRSNDKNWYLLLARFLLFSCFFRAVFQVVEVHRPHGYLKRASGFPMYGSNI